MLTKLLTKKVPFTFNRAGYYYFSRRVPADLTKFYSYPRIVQGLKTRSAQTAKSQAMVAASKLDEYWSHLRLTDSDLVGRHLLKQEYQSNLVNSQPELSSNSRIDLTLADALDTYLSKRGLNKGKTFHSAARRACTYLVECCGVKQLAEYSRIDALLYRDDLIARGLTGSSVGRVISSIRAVFNFTISEYALEIKNPFMGMYLDKTIGVSKRYPIPIDDIKRVQNKCRIIDDDMRWLIALVLDTGLRLAEAAGLLKSDIILDAELPFLTVTVHPWRALKTSGSERVVPLVNSALWAADSIIKANSDSLFAFPRYNKTSTTNANSASAALNKWLQQFVPRGCSMHSFRHSMRDRLRAVECPSEIIDQIGGWATHGVGQGYGQGYGLEICSKWLGRI